MISLEKNIKIEEQILQRDTIKIKMMKFSRIIKGGG